MPRSTRDTLSVFASSFNGGPHIETPTFCVVCGHFSAELVLRKSGLKCAGCVGKSANKHWARLQHRQANELLSQATVRARQLSSSTIASAREPLCDSSTLDSSELSSRRASSARAVEMCKALSMLGPNPPQRRISAPLTRSDTANKAQPLQPRIQEYIVDTACYRNAAAGLRVQDSLSSSRNDGTGSSSIPAPAAGHKSAVKDTANPLAQSSSGTRRRRAPATPPPRKPNVCPKQSNEEKKSPNKPETSVQMRQTHNAVSLDTCTATPVVLSCRAHTVVEATEALKLDGMDDDPQLPALLQSGNAHRRLAETSRSCMFVDMPQVSRPSGEAIERGLDAPHSETTGSRVSDAVDPPPAPVAWESSAVSSLRGQDAQEYLGCSLCSDGQRHVPAPVVFALAKTARLPNNKTTGQSRVFTPVKMVRTSQTSLTRAQAYYVDPASKHFSRCDPPRTEAVAASSGSSSSSSSSSSRSSASSSSSLSASNSVEEGTGAPPMASGTRGYALTVNMDHLYVTVELTRVHSLSEESSGPSLPSSATNRLVSGGNNMNSSGVTTARVPSAPGSKFTVTRHFYSAFQQQENSGSPSRAHCAVDLRASGDSSLASRRRRVGATGQDAVKAKQLSLVLIVRDRDTNDIIHTVKRCNFLKLISIFQELKTLMNSLPAVPKQRIPRSRHITDVYLTERREECQVFMDAVVQNHFLIRHPKIVDLLRLEPYLCQPQAPSQDQKLQQQQQQPQQPQQQKHHHHHRHRRGTLSKSVSPETEGSVSVKQPLNSAALNQLRKASSTTGYCRELSISSLVSTSSSVARRGVMDAVCREDLERVQMGNFIGRGSFGTVYLGLLSGSSAVVAVKVVHVNEKVEEGFLLSMQKELDVLRAVRHKNIIRFLGSTYLSHERELRMFTEYIECGNVLTMTKKFGCLPLSVIQKYMKEIIHGLHYLHNMAIVHRDIKGENILITKKGCCKLTDFGCSGTLQEVEGREGIQGSPMWIAPEIIYGASPATSGDIWALGCVGIEMLQRPIWNFSPHLHPHVFLYRVAMRNMPPHGLPTEEELETYNKEDTQEEYQSFKLYRDFLCRCLCVNPEERWSAADLLKHPFFYSVFANRLRWLPPEGNLPGIVSNDVKMSSGNE